MATVKLTYPDENGNDVEFTVPSHKEVCGTCRGEGKHSAHLGAFSREDMDNDPEFFESYMSGFYDRQCETCKGERVVDVVNDPETFTPKQKAHYQKYQEWVNDEYEYQQACEMERRMGA